MKKPHTWEKAKALARVEQASPCAVCSLPRLLEMMRSSISRAADRAGTDGKDEARVALNEIEEALRHCLENLSHG